MSFLPIYKTLVADPDVFKRVGDRIYEDIAGRNPKTPYVVWQEVGGPALNNLDCAAQVDHVMYQVMIYDTNQLIAYEVRDSVRRVLEKHSYVLNARINNYEQNTKLFARGFDANWFLDR